MEIIYGINPQLLRTVERSFPGDMEKQRRMSIIEEGPEKHVSMAHLAIVGSHAVNGVSRLHTKLLKESLVPEFAALWPERFSNKTNGVAPRRWILKANHGLADLLTSTVGDRWITDLSHAAEIEKVAEDAAFQQEFLAIKRRNKVRLAQTVLRSTGISLDPDSLFDVQVKRIHEYKRQLLNVMRVIHEYLSILEHPEEQRVPWTYIFAGKSAPGYWAAKQIIKLIHNVAAVVNADPIAREPMKVVSSPTNTSPAATRSEHLPPAGREPPGTGNMKLAMNGALTLGTLDGANIEIMDAVGKPNIYTFGLSPDEVRWYREQGTYDPRRLYEEDPILRRVIDSLIADRFSPDEHSLFRWIVDGLLDRGDRYFVMADLPAYIEASHRAEADYADPAVWAPKAILNVARVAYFSSDRTVTEYANEIWGIRSALSASAPEGNRARLSVVP